MSFDEEESSGAPVRYVTGIFRRDVHKLFLAEMDDNPIRPESTLITSLRNDYSHAPHSAIRLITAIPYMAVVNRSRDAEISQAIPPSKNEESGKSRPDADDCAFGPPPLQ
jgi:hypothetical protein